LSLSIDLEEYFVIPSGGGKAAGAEESPASEWRRFFDSERFALLAQND
jgi:hypothetical protein